MKSFENQNLIIKTLGKKKLLLGFKSGELGCFILENLIKRLCPTAISPAFRARATNKKPVVCIAWKVSPKFRVARVLINPWVMKFKENDAVCLNDYTLIKL